MVLRFRQKRTDYRRMRRWSYETFSDPRSFACASERYAYAPFFSISDHVTEPLKATPVFLFTPGPVRWKLSFALRSRTVSVVLPDFALLRIVIFAPGPTLAASFWAATGVGGGGGGGGGGGVAVVVVVVVPIEPPPPTGNVAVPIRTVLPDASPEPLKTTCTSSPAVQSQGGGLSPTLQTIVLAVTEHEP